MADTFGGLAVALVRKPASFFEGQGAAGMSLISDTEQELYKVISVYDKEGGMLDLQPGLRKMLDEAEKRVLSQRFVGRRTTENIQGAFREMRR